MMRFFIEVKISDGLRAFYWTDISESVKHMEEFQILNRVFKRNK